MKHDIKLLKEWFDTHYLKLNIEKTTFIVITNHKDIPDCDQDTGIPFENKIIKRAKNMTYLGLVIDENLS